MCVSHFQPSCPSDLISHGASRPFPFRTPRHYRSVAMPAGSFIMDIGCALKSTRPHVDHRIASLAAPCRAPIQALQNNSPPSASTSVRSFVGRSCPATPFGLLPPGIRSLVSSHPRVLCMPTFAYSCGRQARHSEAKLYPLEVCQGFGVLTKRGRDKVCVEGSITVGTPCRLWSLCGAAGGLRAQHVASRHVGHQRMPAIPELSLPRV